jgi:hypothetical protein
MVLHQAVLDIPVDVVIVVPVEIEREWFILIPQCESGFPEFYSYFFVAFDLSLSLLEFLNWQTVIKEVLSAFEYSLNLRFASQVILWLLAPIA